jgi:uncharacterized BrkB/YihY/UPF0761 family membrane protein
MRSGPQEKSAFLELGERSIRAFFEHPMATYAAALAYRGLFGLFPFVLILVVLVGALGFPTSSTGPWTRLAHNLPATFPSNSNRWSSQLVNKSNHC